MGGAFRAWCLVEITLTLFPFLYLTPDLPCNAPSPIRISQSQVLGQLKLSLGYVHVIGFVLPDFPVDESLTFPGPQFPFCQDRRWGQLVSKNLSHTYDWVFVLAFWGIAFHIGHPESFCGLRDCGGMKSGFHPIAKEGTK